MASVKTTRRSQKKRRFSKHSKHHHRSFHSTRPVHGIMDWLRLKLDNEGQGTLVGTDPKGHKYYEWVDPRISATAPPRRRVEYAGEHPAPNDLHVLWEAWLRHSRRFPPTDDEMMRYQKKMDLYKQKVAIHEHRDQKLRLEEQMQRKLTGETIDQSQMSVESYVNQLEAQMAKIRAQAANDIKVQEKQFQEENQAAPTHLQNLQSSTKDKNNV